MGSVGEDYCGFPVVGISNFDDLKESETFIYIGPVEDSLLTFGMPSYEFLRTRIYDIAWELIWLRLN